MKIRTHKLFLKVEANDPMSLIMGVEQALASLRDGNYSDKFLGLSNEYEFYTEYGTLFVSLPENEVPLIANLKEKNGQ